MPNEVERLQAMETKLKNRYKEQNKKASEEYDRITIIVPKGQKQIIKDRATNQGKNVNKYIYDLIVKDGKQEITAQRTEKPVEAQKTNDSRISQLTAEIERKKAESRKASVLTAEAEKTKTNDEIKRLINSAQENRTNKD